MIKALILDTCNAPMQVIGINGIRHASRKCNGVQRQYNSAVLPLVDEILTELDISIRDIEVVACVTGAGSFTGIRIGVSTATALARGIGAKIVALTEFDVMANGHEGKILTAIDAGHGNYYAAEYHDGKVIAIDNVTQDYVDAFDGKVIKYAGALSDESYISAFTAKYNAQEFVEKLVPMYLKESQAERERAAAEQSKSN